MDFESNTDVYIIIVLICSRTERLRKNIYKDRQMSLKMIFLE